jgi:hypothetical protein
MKPQQTEKIGFAFTGLISAIVIVPVIMFILFIFFNGI